MVTVFCVGHWVGDPCEFTSLSLHVLPLTEYKELQEIGSKYAVESQLSFGMTAGFGSCAAQAYNQGSFVRSLLRAGVQPTLRPFVCRPSALAQEGRELVG